MTNKTNLTVKDVNSRVEKLAADFQKTLQEFKSEFYTVKSTPLGDTYSEFLTKFEAFEKIINSSLDDIKSDLNNLKDRTEDLKNKYEDYELKSGSNYIVIHGLEEGGQDIYAKVIDLINSKFNINIKKSDINQCYRFRRNSKVKNGRPRPLAVQFCCRWMRDLVFYNKKCLKGSGIIFTEMLAVDVLKLFKKARELMGNSAWTSRGYVYISRGNGKVLIKTSADLETYQEGTATSS